MNTRINRTWLVMFVVASWPGLSGADTISFPEIWRRVAEASLAQEGARQKVESAGAGAARAARHWLPRVYLDARTYKTNDPGSAFFGILEQRKASASDFSPDVLNNPGAQSFSRGALGIDLPIYEGGLKQAQTAMSEHSLAAEKLGASQIEIDQYAHSGVAYGTIASLRRQMEKLRALKADIDKLMKSYQIGQKTNPVGYSGWLGMKSLANRVGGLIEQLEAQEKSAYVGLTEMGIEEKNWMPQDVDAKTFVDRFFTVRGAEDSTAAASYQILAAAEMAQSEIEGAKMEKARYLPRGGVFAESYVFDGRRDTASGYTAGLYLQWKLFDPSDFGAYKEAKLKAGAAEKFSQAARQRENADRKGLAEAIEALRSNLARFEESDKLLAEQTQVSSTLFKNGSIAALQFVEILNRRTDLIAQQAEAELNLLKFAALRVTKSKFEIPKIQVAGGGK